MKKLLIILLFNIGLFVQANTQISTYDISFTGGQWEDVNGNIINPNSMSDCKSIIYNSLLVQVAGGGFGSPGSDFYYLSNGGAVITVDAVDAVILGLPAGTFAQYFNWTLINNQLKGVQNANIPLNSVFDPLNGINGGKIIVQVETPNVINKEYQIFAIVKHANPSVYNTSTDADTEDNNGQNNMNCTLPIKLASFEAKKANTKTVLTWTSTEEVNASHYIVQRSKFFEDTEHRANEDQSFITELGTIDVKGSRSSYSFIDNVPENGVNYYRLKMVDLDGSKDYSDVRAVEFGNSKTEVYPNPFLDNFTIVLGNNVEKVNIYNTAGILLKSINAVNLISLKIDMEYAKAGMYFAELVNNNHSEVKRFKLIKVSN